MSRPSFLSELGRRNVFRAAALYVGAIWALAQGVASLGPAFGMPEWGTRWFVIAGVIGFPFWVAFAWFYEWTPDGFRRERDVEPGESVSAPTNRRLDFVIIGVLALAIVLLLADRFVNRDDASDAAATSATAAAPAPQAPIPTIEADPSIAVLPLVNLSSDKEQEYFSDGISEELMNLLARVPRLRVIARTSSFAFKGSKTPIDEIARTLNVSALLEGSVRKAGDTVRIQVQLVRAVDGAQLWTGSYDRTLDDIFAIQDEIAADVVKHLQVTLLGTAPKSTTTHPEAYALYLQAMQIARQNTAEAYQRSDALLTSALALDPAYAPAWTALARNLTNKSGLGLLDFKDGYRQAREAAMKALEIDPGYAPAHATLGRIAMSGDSDPAAAAEHFKRALALDPRNPEILRSSAVLLQSLGRVDEAMRVNQAIVRRDPVNVLALWSLAVDQRLAGHYDAAIASYRAVLSLAPDSGGARADLGNALLLKGDAEAALAEIEQEGIEIFRLIGLPMAYHALGRTADADAALSALITTHEKTLSFNIAYIHAFRGDADKAFEWLDKAIAYGDSGLVEIATENLFARLHQDPRWLPLLRKLGKAPEQLAQIAFTVTPPE